MKFYFPPDTGQIFCLNIMPQPLNVRDHRSFLLSALSMLRAQSLSHVRLFATPWAVVHQAPLPRL